jgi:hypothetical protein
VEVGGPIECGESISHSSFIRELNSTLGEFDIILSSEDCTGRRADCIQISKVQIELDTAILEALRTSLFHSAILIRQEDGGIVGPHMHYAMR